MKIRDLFHDTFTMEFHLLGFWISLGIWQKRHFRIPFVFHIISPFGLIISINWTNFKDFQDFSFGFLKWRWSTATGEHKKIGTRIDKMLEKEKREREKAIKILNKKGLSQMIKLIR